MDERAVLEIFEKARKASKNGVTNWVFSNGERVVYSGNYDTYNFLKDNGWWTCAIFQYGYRCEA